MAIITSIMADVADAIDVATLVVPVTTTREFVSPRNLEGLDVLRVTVLPEVLDLSGADLAPRAWLDWGVRVWIQQRFEYADQATGIPPLLELSEEIALLFKPGSKLEVTRARSINVHLRPAFDPKMLDENGVFSSQIVIVFRLTQ